MQWITIKEVLNKILAFFRGKSLHFVQFGCKLFSGMFGPGEANPVQSFVKDAVVLGQKYISQNPQWAFRCNNVDGLETAKTQLPAAQDLLKDRERR